MLSTHSSPAVVSASAAGKLPRGALLGLLAAFVLPLFFSTDLWSGRSLSSFGVAWTMANGSLSDWLLPNVNGFAAADGGPLSYWFAALTIKLFGRLFGDVEAFHIAAGIWFAATTAAIWYATYYLSRRDEAQPVSFAFGGEAARKDYGRLVADIAVLLTVGSYGLIVAFHELTPITCFLAFASLTLFGVVLSLRHLWRGSVVAGLSIGAVALSTTPGAGLWCFFGVWIAIFLTPDYTSRSKRAFITLSVAVITALIWPALVFACFPSEAATWFNTWISESVSSFSPLPITDYPWLIKNISWITFPLWPLAAWAVYAWRDQLRQAPFIIPLSFLIVALCSILFTGTELQTTLLYVVPSLAILAAFGVVSLKRSRENFLDLYSGIIYSLAIVVVWLYFFAWTQGTPVKMAYSLTRLAPEVSPHGTSVFLFILAAAATSLWIAIVFWRLFKHPVNAWRGAWMAGSGLTAVWVIVMSLFVNLIDGARSMRPIVNEVSARMAQLDISKEALCASNLSLSNIAAFNYWGNIHFTSPASASWQLRAVDKNFNVETLADGDYEPVSVFSGRPRSSEKFLLLRKKD